MIVTYQVCDITSSIIHETFNLCLQNAVLHAGICCSSLRQLVEVKETLEDIEADSPPWYIDRIRCHANGIVVSFQNHSVMDIFVANESARGKRFHYLRVDTQINENIQTHVLRYLIRDYQFSQRGDNETLEDLLAFAESVLQTPLHHWQRDMLTCMLQGGTYEGGRSIGKTQMLNIHRAWTENPNTLNDNFCVYKTVYTYDQLMKGVSV